MEGLYMRGKPDAKRALIEAIFARYEPPRLAYMRPMQPREVPQTHANYSAKVMVVDSDGENVESMFGTQESWIHARVLRRAQIQDFIVVRRS